MTSWRTLAIAGVSLGATLAALIARAQGLDPSIPLAGALLAVAVLGVAIRPRTPLTYAQLEQAARAHYAAGVRPIVVPWNELTPRRRSMEINAIRAAFAAAEKAS